MTAITIILTIISFIMIGEIVLLTVGIVRKLRHKELLSFSKSLIVIFGAGAVSAAAAYLFVTLVYYRAEPSALSYLESGEKVTVTREGSTYFFDGPGEDKALIFYPGALVEQEAYAEIMYRLAENGIDTFLADMPFHIALFGVDTGNKIIASHTYGKWYMSGHSLGGVAAAEYCLETENDIDGLVLLASYPYSDIDKNIPVCMIFGTEDRVMSPKRYEESKGFFADRVYEYFIEGGNHAQFGSYGEQNGDGKATITPEEQKRITADEIVKFVNDGE